MEAEETAPQCRSQIDSFFHSFTFNHLFSLAAALLVFCILFHLSKCVLQLFFQCQSPFIHVQTPFLCLYITSSAVNRYSVSVWSGYCFSINVSMPKNVQRVGLGLASIHWSAFIVYVFKSYLYTYNNMVMNDFILDTRSHGQTTVFLSFFLSCCFPITHNTVFQDISVKSHLLSFLHPLPNPLFVVYCCGPVRLRSKHTWSLSLAKTLLLLLQLSPFHFCWTFLLWLKSFDSYFCLIQFVCYCHQEWNYSCSWI